jgi:MoaA/NifB/PqqE/SkfB family radical SAM enzyme
VNPLMKDNTARDIKSMVETETLSIEVTSRCNGSCLHCFARSGFPRNKSLSLGLVKGIMSEGYENGYRHLHITGGEPLLWKGLLEALDHGFGLGYETIFINTNGTLITDEVSKRFAAYGRSFSLSVSLEGFKDLHDRIRGKGSYLKTMQGIDKALIRGNDLTIFTTVTKSLLPELPIFVEFMFRSFPNINYLILIQLIKPEKGAFGLSDELLEPLDFIRLVRMVALLNVGGFRVLVKKNPLANVVSTMVKMPWIPWVPPLYRAGRMIIRADKHIGLVHSSRNSFGRYEPGMIQKVLASEKYNTNVAPDQKTCPACRYVQTCKDGGMIRPPQGYDDLNDDTPYCRRVMDCIATT